MKNKVLLFFIVATFSACFSPQKMDAYVSEKFYNQVPKLNKKNVQNIAVASSLQGTENRISVTTKKTSKVLPLIVYWQYDYRLMSRLNPEIAVNNFTNAINSSYSKTLMQKLEGKKLELTVEKAPTDFALVDKGHIIFIVYVISWNKVYMEPDFKDLVVSYKIIQADNTQKSGKIEIKNTMKNKGLRLFQSWRSATSEYLNEYNSTINTMTKSFVTELLKEL